MDSRDSMGLHPPSPSGLGFGAMFHHTILGARGSAGLLHTPSAMRASYSPDFAHSRSSNINTNTIANANANTNANANANTNTNMDGSTGMGSGGGVKRKRGRPRKYGPDGSMALALTPLSSAPGPTLSSPTVKRGRGRPPGSGKKQQLAALGSAGVGFTPHVIAVAAGEDVATKIMSFSQQGPRAVCILSANGAISNVTLRQPATSGGTVTYEGRFEILSLSGSFLLTETGGTRSRSGGLSVSLAGSDGRVVGGGVAGMLVAATPVQVVVGSFLANSKKNQARPATAELPPYGTGSSVPGSASVPIFSGMVNKASTSRVGSYESQMLTQGSGVLNTNNAQQPQGTTMLASLHSMGFRPQVAPSSFFLVGRKGLKDDE